MAPLRPLLALYLAIVASASIAGQSSPVDSVAHLPGRGLAQHDFLYAGEAHERRIVIVRGGKVVWSYDDPGTRGEISDAVMLSNGNILYAHQFGITEITPAKTVVWNYDVPAGHEAHTAVPIGLDRVLWIENGPEAMVHVVNLRTGIMEREFPLAVKQPVSVHGQFRHARLTPQGTLLVAHADLDKVVEYDSEGKALWSFPATGAWGVTPLANGNVLLTDRLGVREITRRGDTAWSWKPADTPDFPLTSLQQAWRLPNGDTLINNWVNEWNFLQPGGKAGKTPQVVQAIELTPEKKVVWALRSWDAPNLGPATTIQILDEPTRPEDVHFGSIR